MSEPAPDLTIVATPKPARPVLPRALSFWAVAAMAYLGFGANAAASPLYRLYQAEFRFSAATLTLLFSVYVVVVLVTLLFVGRMSDYAGRRPVLLAGLALGAAACCLFLVAHALAVLFAARAVQGVAVGLISPTSGATLLDLRPGSRAAPVVAGAAPTVGLAIGALGTSALAQYAAAPTRLVWWLLAGAFLAGIVAVLFMPETADVRPRPPGSLRPQISVPRGARGAFAAAVPCLVGVWALGGLYQSLGPSLAALLLHSANVVWGGLIIFVLTSVAAASATLLAGKDARAVMLSGCLALIAGSAVTFIAILTGAPALLFAGTAVAGFGFGTGLTGAFRLAVAHAPAGDRAGLVTAIYVISYLASGAPVVVGGVAATRYGLHDTALVYSLTVAALAAGAVGMLLGQARGPRPSQ
jgi:predicted MFS family arabinose efflux permease